MYDKPMYVARKGDKEYVFEYPRKAIKWVGTKCFVACTAYYNETSEDIVLYDEYAIFVMWNGKHVYKVHKHSPGMTLKYVKAVAKIIDEQEFDVVSPQGWLDARTLALQTARID